MAVSAQWVAVQLWVFATCVVTGNATPAGLQKSESHTDKA